MHVCIDRCTLRDYSYLVQRGAFWCDGRTKWCVEMMLVNAVFWKSRCQVIELKDWCCVKQRVQFSPIISRNIIICLYSGSPSHDANCIMLSEFMEYFKAVPCLMIAGLISLPHPDVRSPNCMFIYVQENSSAYRAGCLRMKTVCQYTSSCICEALLIEMT